LLTLQLNKKCKNGAGMNKVIFAALLGLGFSVMAYAQQTSTPPTTAKPAAAQAPKYDFKAADSDGDGRISRAEAKKYGISDAEFKKYDKDNSGFIEQKEVFDWIK
jgi:Ca2+-binding EF-hand superfamily protein